MSYDNRTQNPWTIPDSVMELHKDVLRRFLTGRVSESARLRGVLIRRLLRELEAQPRNPRLWCLLGDTYTFTKKRMGCYRKALRAEPNDAEANAEIARLYAAKGDRRYAMHFDRALQYCRGIDIEDSIISAALEAARKAKDETRVKRALRIGRNRFPEWFTP